MRKKTSTISKIITIIFMVIILTVSYQIYKKNNFNDYIKAEYNLRNSRFTRDNKVKYNDYDSYKIENLNYNDAMFFKTIDVIPNTPYKVTCKIKTENVESMKPNTDSGAHICLGETFEKSDNVIGTTDWTEVIFYFNSKNRTQVDVGFRLGGIEDDCIGTAWFSDFTIESGLEDTSNYWNFLCVVFDNVNVTIDNKNVKLQLTQIDKDDIGICMQRFKTAMEEMTAKKIKVSYDILEEVKPITNISYDDENGYYVSGYDVKDVLDPYIEQGKYDHIFIAFRTGDINQKGAIPVNDWIGLGSMEYRGLGFSNIRLPDDDNSYMYKYSANINTFPEEVFVHEFLHTLERNAEEYGYERPDLHDNSLYGYENQRVIGLKDWYNAYMNKTIKTSNGMVGLPSEIYTKKPVQKEDFYYFHKLNYLNEPENIIEELNNVVEKVIRLFSTLQKT